jgi:hypothetical protein
MLAVTAGVSMWAFSRPGLYFSQSRVLFLAPPSDHTPNNLVAPSDSLITTAGVVAKMVGASFAAPPVVSDTVTLPGEGITHGWSAHLPNIGGQWAPNFSEPAVVVQAVAPTPAEVEALMADVLGRVRAAVTTLEDRASVAPVNRIVLASSPEVPAVEHVSGSGKRGAATVLVLGVSATWACWLGLSAPSGHAAGRRTGMASHRLKSDAPEHRHYWTNSRADHAGQPAALGSGSGAIRTSARNGGS